METSIFNCAACGSTKRIEHAKLVADVTVFVAGARREAWKDDVYANSPIAVDVCAECGHIMLRAADLAALREAAAKIGN